MPAGTQPIFVATPKSNAVAVTAANTKNDGAGTIGTDIFVLYTAGANGAWIGKVRFTISASTAATATTATVLRVYQSTQQSGATTNANTFRIDEIQAPSFTADQTSTQTPVFDVYINSFLTGGQTILVSSHAAPAASTAIHAIALGTGDY